MGDCCPSCDFGWCCILSSFVHVRHEHFRDVPFRLKTWKQREGRRCPGTGGETVESLKCINPDF